MRSLREHPGTVNVLLILLSGRMDDTAARSGLAGRADDSIAAPWFAEELLARVQAHIDLARARARREASKLREEFIDTVAHELQTSLTSIQVGLSLLEAEVVPVSREVRDVLAVMGRNAQRLEIHIGDLITANQLNAGILELQSVPLDLRDVVQDAAESVRAPFREKGKALALALPEPLPIVGDPRRLEQVLVNLLGNALRYTPTEARVAVTGRANEPTIHLTVADTGRGIPEGELERIFECQRRLDPGHGGSGLGLTTARSLIELHGGRIWAENAPAGGAIFHITHPIGWSGASEDNGEPLDAGGRSERCAS